MTTIAINLELDTIKKSISNLRENGCTVYYNIEDDKLTIVDKKNKDTYQIPI